LSILLIPVLSDEAANELLKKSNVPLLGTIEAHADDELISTFTDWPLPLTHISVAEWSEE
jgi:hypothetical protein